MVLRNNTFSQNRAGESGYGGAVGLYGTSDNAPISARMSSNTFSRNRAGTQSGYGYGGAVSTYYYVTIRDKGSTFSHNSARGDGAYGGAVSMASSYISSTWTRTRFIGNSAGTNSSGNEGYGGAFYSSNESGDAFTQVTMSGNEAAYEGGAYYGDNDAYEATFRSSTISDNTAGTSSLAGDGGGIYADDTVLVVQNSTLTGNKATSVSGDAGQGGAIYVGGSRLGLRYSTVSGNVAKQGAGVFSNTYGNVLGSILSRNKTSSSGSEQDCTTSDPTYKLKSHADAGAYERS